MTKGQVKEKPAPDGPTTPEGAGRPRKAGPDPRIQVWRAVIAIIGLLIAMAEIDRLIGGTLTYSGRVYSMTAITGIDAFSNVGAWQAWEDSSFNPAALVMFHVFLDGLFIACYGWLLLRIPSQVKRWAVAVWILIAADLAEGLASFALATWVYWVDFPRLIPPEAVAASSVIKWLATGVVAVLLIRMLAARAIDRRRTATKPWWSGIVEVYHALATHRAAIVVVIALAVVSLLPQAGVLEQLPDIQRSWISWNPDTHVAVPNWRIAPAVVLAVGLWLLLFVMGRVRSSSFRTLSDTKRDAPGGKIYALWAVLPAAGLAAVGLIAWLGGDDWYRDVDIEVALVFFGITIGLPLISLLFAWRLRHKNLEQTVKDRDPGAFQEATPERITRVERTGDAVASLAVVVFGLGLIRSFIGPAVMGLPAYQPPGSPELTWITWISVVILAAGAYLAVYGDFVADRLRRLLLRILGTPPAQATAATPQLGTTTDARTQAASTPLRRKTRRSGVKWGVVTRGIFSGIAALFLLALSLFPLQITRCIEALPTTVLVLGAWAILLTNVETGLQEKRPLDVFRVLGFRATPLLLLFIIVPLLVAQAGLGTTVHALKSSATVALPGGRSIPDTVAGAEPIDDRPTLLQALEQWTEREQCEVRVRDGSSYRPLILVAAQGGGIRAATWTIYAMREFLESGDDCTANSVLLSSGASGGSVGLTTFRGYEPGDEAIDPADLGDQDALAVGLSGTLVSDVVASVTGLHLPSMPGYGSPGDWNWQDRAALIQAAWADDMPQLAARFDWANQTPTGYLILNSTAAGSGCRALVSQINLQVGTSISDDGSGNRAANCSQVTPGVSAVIDIQDYCALDIDWAGAAMLSSRFPIVTPSARIGVNDPGTCGTLADQQFVDGGYTENSGLGTLSDLAPELASLIASENATRGDEPPIVPLVLYLRNEAGADVTAPPLKPSSELIVPVLANNPDALISDGAWLQRLSDTLDVDDVCAADDGACIAAVTHARQTAPGGVAVSAPATEPTIVAPLGWTLSDLSQATLKFSAEAQAEPGCPPTTGYGHFGGLLDLLSNNVRCVPTTID
jgi:hypothetical protein